MKVDMKLNDYIYLLFMSCVSINIVYDFYIVRVFD